MNSRKMLGIGCIIVGAVMLFFSNYIADQVAAGKLQTASGQRQIDQTNSLFNRTQYTKPFGSVVTGSGQARVDAGNLKIAQFETLQGKLQIGGIVLIVLGIGILVFWRKK